MGKNLSVVSEDLFMKISVVIPMYNSRDTIIKSLDSIKYQTALDKIFEIIVVNDGSTDDSLEIVKKYKELNPSLTIIIIDKHNGGVSVARNEGMKIAKGDWIALLDSDDEWLPNKIEYQCDIINNNTEIDFLGGGFDYADLRILFRKIKGLYKANINDLCVKFFPSQSTAIFKKRIFEEIGGFDENQRYAEEGSYFMKICLNYNYFFVPEVFAFSTTSKPCFGYSGLSGNLRKMYEGNLKNIKELRDKKIIGANFYVFLRYFYWLKYLRRIIGDIIELDQERKRKL